jgi:hypothetical protein
VLTCLVCVIVAVSDFTGHYAIALGAGVLVGAVMFMLGASKGGMRPIGLAAPHLMPKGPKQANDPNSSVGSALAASGIASSVFTNMHYPNAFRIFYTFCIVAGIVIALIMAWRGRNFQPSNS